MRARRIATAGDASHGASVRAGSGCRTRSKGVAAAGSSTIVWFASAISFRLSGPDHLHDIEARIAAEARAVGTAVSSTFSSEQVAQLQDLAAARKDSEFAEFVSRITKL